MTDPGLSSLLKWSVENSAASADQPVSTEAAAPPDTARGLPAHALAALFGGPSDADLMRESMTAITSSTVSLPDKLIAFDNLEQLVENIDNANNLAPLGLWEPLAGQLRAPEPDLRRMAAWCVGTAAQNNVAAQERILVLGIIPTLIDISINDDTEATRRKAIFALSSCIRNYQPGLDAAQEALPADQKVDKKLDAADMASVDVLIQKLRDHSQQKA